MNSTFVLKNIYETKRLTKNFIKNFNYPFNETRQYFVNYAVEH